MARRLKTIARWINENVPDLKAEVVKGHYNTDLKVGRLRIPKKGRHGNKLVVYKNDLRIFSHNSAAPFRTNDEVERWLAQYLKEQGSPRSGD